MGLRSCTILLALSCGSDGPSPAEQARPIIDAHRAEVVQIQRAMRTIGEAIAREPREGATGADAVTLDFWGSASTESNAALMEEGDFRDLSRPPAGTRCRFRYDTPFSRPVALIERGYAGPVFNATEQRVMETAFAQLRSIRYVSVCRTFEYRLPALNGNTIVPGHHRGDVLLYDLTTQSRVGRIEFDVTTDHTLEQIRRELGWFNGPANHLGNDVWRAIRDAYLAAGARVVDPSGQREQAP